LVWSITLYDAETTTMYPNPLGRTNIGDRTKGLRKADDGSLTTVIQNEQPSNVSNWLPEPEGPFYLVIRCYGADELILNGRWAPPPV
jgi:hypothetical protein